MIHLESSTRMITEEEKRKLTAPKQELPTWAIALISIGFIACLGVAIYIAKKADEPTRRVRPI